MPLALAQEGTPDWPGILSVADAWDATQAGIYYGGGVAASALYTTAALGYFIPVRISQRRTFVRAWWLNGTAVAGNADLGVYTISGTTATRLQSIGATVQAGVSTMQTVTISWTFDPGLYYLAFSHSEAVTGTYWKSSVSQITGRVAGYYQAAAQSPLAATPTVVAWAALNAVPHFGLAEQSVV